MCFKNLSTHGIMLSLDEFSAKTDKIPKIPAQSVKGLPFLEPTYLISRHPQSPFL